MSQGSTKPPSGMRDFLPIDVARRQHVVSLIQRQYEAHGFVPLETPTIERLSTLLGKYGEEGDQLLYRLLHRRDALKRPVEQAHAEGRAVTEAELADLGLRYDLTVPLARVVAQYKDLPRFFRRYQIQPVWRADRPGKGRFREFYQCDVDITGTSSRVAEAEICSAVTGALHDLGFGVEGGPDFVIRMNHRELLRAMIRACEIPSESEESALVAVDKLDKIGVEGVSEELVGRGISATSAERLLGIVGLAKAGHSNAELLAALRGHVDDRGVAALDALAEVVALCESSGAAKHLSVSPDLARGLSYYTGPIFEIAVDGLAGSLGGGGRYDELVGMFGKQSIPAVGFALGLERILVVMAERGMFPELRVGPQLMMCWMDVEPGAMLDVVTRLRAQSIDVEVYPEPAKLKKQLQYADRSGSGVAWAAILGKSELETGTVTLKHMDSGEQTNLPVDEVASHLAARVLAASTPD